MAVKNIYKYAAKNKLRFPFKGNITLEDLYDLSLVELDSIYKTLKRQVKTDAEESLLSEETKEDKALAVKIEIITEIVNEKKTAEAAKKKAAETKLQNQKIAAIIARKEDEDLNNKSIDELKSMLASDSADDDDDEDDDE